MKRDFILDKLTFNQLSTVASQCRELEDWSRKMYRKHYGKKEPYHKISAHFFKYVNSIAASAGLQATVKKMDLLMSIEKLVRDLNG